MLRVISLGVTCTVLLVWCGYSAGAPAVTSVSGGVTHGGSVTIGGSSFGAKSQAAPIIWDNFENGSDGQSLTGRTPVIGPNWQTWLSNGFPPTCCAGAINRPNSLMSSRHDYMNHQYTCSLQYMGVHQTVYFTFWWKYHKAQSYFNRNTKPWIVYGQKDGMWPAGYIGVGNPDYADGSLRSSVQDQPTMPSSPTMWGGPDISQIVDEWVRIEQFLEQSTPSVSDGTFMTWVQQPYHNPPSLGLRLNSGRHQYMTRTSTTDWTQWWIGSFFAQDTEPAGGGLVALGYLYTDDIYFDTTMARVEIGDASTWSGCTRREIQVPTAWSDSSITATVNRGSFPIGASAWLYVVDSDGNANSTGYPVTLSGGTM